MSVAVPPSSGSRPAGELAGTAPVAGTGIADRARAWVEGVRAGDLGSLPIVVGLVVIAIVFQAQNDRFLTAGNFVNLIVQGAAIATIAIGVVFVLLLGEIDLSIGYVSGVAGVIASLLLLPDGNTVSWIIAVLVALAAGAAIGVLHGIIITKVGIPSFVVTLAGLLAWNGVVLLLIGTRGTVVLQDQTVIGVANDFLSEGMSWLLVLVCVGGFAALELTKRRKRQKVSLPADSMALIGLRVGALALALAVVVYVCNQDRGLPFVAVIVGVLLVFWTWVARRTKFGRYVYAVGGNAEAARRAGIDVDRIRIAVFAIASFMAAVGGIILASRLRSVDTNAGGGTILLYSIAAAVIGGTSLFGGRGHVRSALLGALVIASIDNGLGLLGLSAGTRFVVTGLVLLLAVAVDSITRRGREQHGRV
jgi:D-xylose transport system permease protein